MKLYIVNDGLFHNCKDNPRCLGNGKIFHCRYNKLEDGKAYFCDICNFSFPSYLDAAFSFLKENCDESYGLPIGPFIFRGRNRGNWFFPEKVLSNHNHEIIDVSV